uniref:hypothetical protein n=1 Tax=Vibrio litoralis TaxID=335972 RepID=UPI001D046FD2
KRSCLISKQMMTTTLKNAETLYVQVDEQLQGLLHRDSYVNNRLAQNHQMDQTLCFCSRR